MIMKKPEIEVVAFDPRDVIVTSGAAKTPTHIYWVANNTQFYDYGNNLSNNPSILDPNQYLDMINDRRLWEEKKTLGTKLVDYYFLVYEDGTYDWILRSQYNQ